MGELPAGVAASDADLAEAASLVDAITAGDPSLVSELVADLATGVRSRPLLITAADELAGQAADHWLRVLAAAGIEAHRTAAGQPPAGLARVHLHGSNITAEDYPGAVIDAAGGELVGEVIGQGHSAAARYLTLAVFAEALAGELLSAPPE